MYLSLPYRIVIGVLATLVVLSILAVAAAAHTRPAGDEIYGGLIQEVWYGECHVDNQHFTEAICLKAQVSRARIDADVRPVGLWAIPPGWTVKGTPPPDDGTPTKGWKPGMFGIFRTDDCRVYEFEPTKTMEEALRFVIYDFDGVSNDDQRTKGDRESNHD
jgi:hypothetical protein